MFSIQKADFGKIVQYFLTNDITGEQTGILPGYGATLNQLKLKKKNTIYDLIDGNSGYEYLISEGTHYCKGMVLFPFPNRICAGQYTFEGVSYQLLINETERQNAIHGFAFNKAFEVIEEKSTENYASIKMSFETSGNDEGYPFKCKIIVKYILTEKKGLICDTCVVNLDSKNVPVGVGWHPYLKINDEKIDDLSLKIPANEEILINERMIPIGRKKVGVSFAKRSQINNTQFDTGYVIEYNGKKTRTTSLRTLDKTLKVKLWQETGKDAYNFLQIYTPPHRKSIAIEPMTCAVDAFNNGLGLMTLKPGNEKKFSFGILID